MELKDVILSTLAEMEDEPAVQTTTQTQEKPQQSEPQQSEPQQSKPQETKLQEPQELAEVEQTHTKKIDSELAYLNSIRERLLVLFEGFQAPNNSNIEAKVDMTLNFLEYTLATIDERVQTLEKGDSQ